MATAQTDKPTETVEELLERANRAALEGKKQPDDNRPLSIELELFCKAYVSSGDSTQAWKAAFREDGNKKDIKALLSRPDVDKRISFLMSKRLELMQHSAQVDIDMLVRELEQARQLAIKNDEPAAAISATMGKAKLHGLLVDKREMAFKRPEDMTEAELLKALGFDSIDDLMASEGQLVIENMPADDEKDGIVH